MTTPISSASQGSELAKAIVRNFDSDGDGKLSTDEFGAFLTNLVAGIKTSDGASNVAGAGTSLPPVVSPIGADPTLPPVSSSPIDDSNQLIDFDGPFFTNMPTLPTPPGWDTEPDTPSGILNEPGFPGDGDMNQSPKVIPNSLAALFPSEVTPMSGKVHSSSQKTVARSS
jgi:hypothetical protein